jgi:hypothetical protein
MRQRTRGYLSSAKFKPFAKEGFAEIFLSAVAEYLSVKLRPDGVAA